MNYVFQDPLDQMTHALFHSMSVDGVYARTHLFERVIDGLNALISRTREPETEILKFPPVMSRHHLEKSGYLNSFPQLLGGVCCLGGGDAQIHAAVDRFNGGQDWTPSLAPTELVLAPAACYPVYPLVAARGPVPKSGLRFDVACDCFRREASRHLDRMQAFRMREYVYVGGAGAAVDFREHWISRARELADRLGLAYRIAPASDPFFGRAGKILATNQVEQALKLELLIPMRSQERPTACMSFNYHRDQFGTIWDLRTARGDVAHSACVAFGMDRLALALFAIHGIDILEWPQRVRGALEL